MLFRRAQLSFKYLSHWNYILKSFLSFAFSSGSSMRTASLEKMWSSTSQWSTATLYSHWQLLSVPWIPWALSTVIRNDGWVKITTAWVPRDSSPWTGGICTISVPWRDKEGGEIYITVVCLLHMYFVQQRHNCMWCAICTLTLGIAALGTTVSQKPQSLMPWH